MKRGLILAITVFLCLFSLLFAPHCFSETKEEREERTLTELKRIKTASPPDYRFSARGYLFSGYDTNAFLSPARKGDTFEQFLYSLYFSKPLIEGVLFTAAYDLQDLNYNEFTDLSNLLNHFRFGLHKKISPFTIGSGYDLNIVYYPQNDDDYFLHEGLVYVRQDILKNIYHQLQWAYGLKDYTDAKALSDTITTYQYKDRRDKRQKIEYGVFAALSQRLRSRFKSTFSINDSNARYLDFYDYKAYTQYMALDYKAGQNLHILPSFLYRRKYYDTRTVTLEDYKERDVLYAGRMGVSYQFNKKNTLSLDYTYQENSSNEPLAEYSESIITCGWQYNF